MNPTPSTWRALWAPAFFLVAALPVLAADTLETWAAGSGDIDFYLTMDGMGRQAEAQSVAGDMMLGWGVADRLSTYLAVSLAADGTLTGGGAEMGVGLFGTPVDSDHVDLDLVLDLCAGGPGLAELCLGPALELNLDAAPDLSAWGLYARAGLALSGRSGEAAAKADRDARRLDGLLTVGSYLALDSRRQLLLEYDVAFRDEPAPGEPAVERGGLALGYNHVLGDRFEFISQAYWDVPQGDQDGALGVTFGFIATLPATGETSPRDLP